MISFALDSNNDLIIEGGNFKTVDNAAQVLQHVRTRLLFYLEEWFLDIAAGTPYFQEIFVKPTNLANVESILKTRILETPEVDKLNTFSMNYEPNIRKLTISFTAETVYGEINADEVTINV